MRNKKKELSIIKNLKNLLFLISPFWKYGKIYLLGMLFFSVILTPIKSTISILFTQTIIDAVGAGKTFNSIVIIILFFLTFNLITFVLSQLFDSIYAEKKLIQINQKINLEIYNKIILTDYKFFDDPAFYDSYTWTTNEYVLSNNKENISVIDLENCLYDDVRPYINTYAKVFGEAFVSGFAHASNMKYDDFILSDMEEYLHIKQKVEEIERTN